MKMFWTMPTKKKDLTVFLCPSSVTFSLHLFSLSATHPPHVLSMPSYLCLPIFSLCLHIWLSLSSLSFTYLYLPQISVFTFYLPHSFIQPCFNSSSLYISVPSLHFSVFFLSALCFTLLPVLANISPTLFYISAWSACSFSFYLSPFHLISLFSPLLLCHCYICIYSPFLSPHLTLHHSLAHSFLLSVCTSLSSSTDPAFWLSSDIHW